MRKRMRSTAFSILVVILIQILINVAIPIKSIAAEEIVTIQCNDVNFYNGLISNLGDKVQSKDDTNKTINMTKTNVESVTKITISGFYKKDDEKIRDITGIDKLTSLTSLVLDYNKISDISELGGLTSLTDLSLSNNQISEISELGGLTNLKTLYLSKNQISDISELGGLTNLKTLYLPNNQISDISELGGLTNLKTLYLSNNQISDISELGGLTSLTKLSLSNNQISEISELGGLTSLTSLGLSNNQISDISELGGLTNLKALYLSKNQISDISALAGLSGLSTFYLSNQKIKATTRNKEIELPQIIKAAKDGNSKIYTEKDYILTNCTLSSDGTKIIVDSGNIESVSIEINGGNADGTICTVILDTTPPTVDVKNSITAPTNQNVTVTITANEEIQEVEGWTLSTGKTILTKEYTENVEETVEVKDLAGNITTANVKIANIDKIAPKVEVKSSTTEKTNQDVTVTITANEEIKEVRGWTLGSDKKTLTKKYSENKTETIIIMDLAGNTTTAEITVNNIDKIVPKAMVKYSTVDLTNQNVTVTITADEEIQEVEGWTLDSSRKILIKEYTENAEETVEIKNIAGNTTTANVKIANIDKIAPKVEVKNSTTEKTNQDVTVTITANKEIQEVEGWTLSSDKKTLTKKYSENKTETITIMDLAGNTTTAEITVNNIEKIVPKVTVKYSIVNPTNQNVTVTITSDKEIQEVTGWNLDTSKKILTKEYTENTEEMVEVKDLLGNGIKANVKITNIDKTKPTVTVKKSITTQTNQDVTVTITANEEIRQVVGWTLSSDKKTLTKIYNENKTETVTITDLAGNTATAEIKVSNIDKIAPKVTVKYSTLDPTTQNVTVTITSDKEIQKIEGWTLDSSRKILTKEYTENTEETVEVKDLLGNIIKADVKIANIDKIAPKAEVSYSTTDPVNGRVKVEISVNETIQVLEGWIYDEENSIIYKEYDANTEETVTITDLAGNETKVKIKVDNIINSSSQDSTIKNNNADNTISTIPIPKAGIKISILIALMFMIIFGYVSYKKYGKYKDIK